MLTHQIMNSREALGGIPTETCVTCHNRGKRVGVTFQGLMEFPYGTPFTEEGSSQPPLHTKKYLYIQDDLHHQTESRAGNPEGGMQCQDCHTSMDMHGDGNIFGTTLAQVEIECADCHGTTDSYPWDLPLGYQEEFGNELTGDARGTTTELLEIQGFGTFYDAEDGFLLTARGNPYGNVVRRETVWCSIRIQASISRYRCSSRSPRAPPGNPNPRKWQWSRSVSTWTSSNVTHAIPTGRRSATAVT
jgi:hypothetical protein